MGSGLEDELGDILQKARDGKSWSQKDLAQAVDLPLEEVRRMERYDLIPPEEVIARLAKGRCLNCMEEQEYDLRVPVNRRDLIHAIEVVTAKADVHLTASIGRNRPKADIRLWKPSRIMQIFPFQDCGASNLKRGTTCRVGHRYIRILGKLFF